MNINKRLFSYPVLSEDKDDYRNTHFNIHCVTTSNINDYNFSFSIDMNNEEIAELIRDNMAEYAIHIECTSTSYRNLLRTSKENCSIIIPCGDINGEVELCGLVVAKEYIDNFSSKDLDDDFNDITFSIKKGSILAYKNLDSVHIQNNNLDKLNSESIFAINRLNKNISTPISVILNNQDKIIISLDTQLFKTYNSMSQRTNTRDIINSLIILPTLVYLFETLKQASEISLDEYRNNDWYRSLERSFYEDGMDFEDEVAKRDSLELAQRLMDNPIHHGIQSLANILDDICED